MQFEWDDDKNEINIQRHKIDFADVPMVFNGPLLTDLIGLLATLTVVVVWTECGSDTIRKISA